MAQQTFKRLYIVDPIKFDGAVESTMTAPEGLNPILCRLFSKTSQRRPKFNPAGIPQSNKQTATNSFKLG